MPERGSAEVPVITDDDLAEFQAQAIERLRVSKLHPIDRLTEQAHKGDKVTLSAEKLLEVIESEASLTTRLSRLEEALERAAKDCEALAPTWHGAGRGQLLAVAVRCRTALDSETKERD